MFYLPCAGFIEAIADPAFREATGAVPVDVPVLSTLRPLAAVTAGNILGGGGLVALMYWFIDLRPERRA
jgi:formate transporter